MTQYRRDALERIQLISDTTKTDINSITRFVVKNLNVSSSEYLELEAAIKEIPGINKTLFGFSPFKNLFEMAAFSDWSDDPSTVLKLSARFNHPFSSVTSYFKLNGWSWTPDLIKQLENSSYFDKIIALNWNELAEINKDYDSLVSYAERCYEQLKFTELASFKTYEEHAGLIKHLADANPDLIDQMQHILLNKTAYKNSLPYMLAVYAWENLNQNGLRGRYSKATNSTDYTDDVRILSTLYKESIDYSVVKDILSKSYASHPEILDHPDLNKNLQDGTRDDLWASPYWKAKFLKAPQNITDSKVAVSILKSNILYSDSAYDACDLYSASTTREALGIVYAASPRFVLSNMLTWIPEAKTIDDIPVTPLTRHVLMLSLRAYSSKDTTFKSDAAKRFPGFNTERGRTKLMERILPGMSVPINQPDLFTTEYLLTVLNSDVVSMKIDPVDLPELN